MDVSIDAYMNMNLTFCRLVLINWYNFIRSIFFKSKVMLFLVERTILRVFYLKKALTYLHKNIITVFSRL